MKWSWKLTRLAGIDVYVHATFFILIAWIGLRYWLLEGNLTAVVTGICFVLALFACVVLHELGHALTARRYGIGTRDIMLLPIGGVASLERMPDDPKQEILVALAGPAVNLVIVVCLWLILTITHTLIPVEQLSLTSGSFLGRLMALNIILAIFNLIPAFPMDGGRVLRALLAMRMSHSRATHLAANIGQFLAIWFGFLGLLYNPFLILIALFVWIGASAEVGLEEIKSTLSGATVGRAMLTDFKVLSPDDSLSHAADLTLESSQKDFPVVKGQQILGILSQTDLLKGLQTSGNQAKVADWMNKQVQSVEIDEPLEQVMQRLETSEYRLLSVYDNGRLTGIINLDNIMELVKIQTAIQDSHQQKVSKLEL